jgi:hypothetical protein
MLLKRVEKESLVKAIYDSSNILASKYDKKTKDLVITFKRGVQYKYYNVSTSDYLRFEISESQGSVLNTHIKQYRTEKCGDVNPDLIFEEISDLKKQEIIDKQLSIISDMEQVVLNYKEHTLFTEPSLKSLINKINNYLNPEKND